MADKVVLDDLTQIAFPSYTQCVWAYNAPGIKTKKDWEVAKEQLTASYHETFKTRLPLYTAKLLRDPEEENRLVLVEPGAVPNFIEFNEVTHWCPSEASLNLGHLEGWPVHTQILPGTALLLEEEHISLKVRLTWCHTKVEGQEEERSVVILAGLFSHILFDGTTRTMTINEWAAVHRKMHDCELESIPFPERAPICDHSVLRGNESPICPKPFLANVFIPHSIIAGLFTVDQPYRRTLRIIFPKSVLEKMQKDATVDDYYVSKNDVLFSWTWITIQKSAENVIVAPEEHGGGQLGMMAVSVRNRYPGFTPRHAGNAVVLAHTKVDDVRNKTVSELARLVREGVNEHSSQKSVQHIIDWAHQIPKDERIPGSFSGTDFGKSFISTQWRNLPMYNANFGPVLGGTPALVLPPFDFEGLLVTLPPRPSTPPPSCPQQLDDEQGVIAQITLLGPSEEERDRFLSHLPEGARLLTELDVKADA